MEIEMPLVKTAAVSCQLGNGTRAALRELLPQDREEFTTFLRRLSERSRYDRFMNARPVSLPLIEHLTRVESRSQRVFAACVVKCGHEHLIAEARFCMLEAAGAAEFAVAVLDEYQGLGLGSLLMRFLIDEACKCGVAFLEANTLATNSRMLALARKFDFRRRSEPGHAFVVNLTRSINSLDTGMLEPETVRCSKPSPTSPDPAAAD